MSGKRKRSRGKKGKNAVPVLQMAVLGAPVVRGVSESGFTMLALDRAVYDLIGYRISTATLDTPEKAVKNGVALLLLSTIGTKVANKTGANKMLKNISGGMVKLA